jgi:predicted ATPase/transcriptional regulator with XRE-family HTH domain
MNASSTKATGFSSNDEDLPMHFGEWLKRRRQELDLTQEQLARLANCSVFAIRKMESGERHPSRQLARTLAQALDIPCDHQDNFIKVARGELSLQRLAALDRPPVSETRQRVQTSPPATNLPRALTPFIGREPELAALGQLLQDPQCSLITIVGPGGIGKTRLAIEAARHSEDLFPDGIWFVPLVPLNAPDLIVPTIADAVDFKFSAPSNQQAQLLHHLCNQKALLILDNAEHLLDGADLFADILQVCPQVKLLVTSRERLNLMSEWIFEIMGLPVPSDAQLEQFESYSSVALFLQSARRVRADFELQAEERRWIFKLCQIMEGMPLGIELSAAWVGLLSCKAITQEIEHNIDFLTVSMLDLPERHRSLRATLDHSWKLLNNDEQAIFSRLSVFQGSFSRKAAEEICGSNFAMLSSLRNKTLLYRTDPDCFHLHEFIRQYAEHKLAEVPGEQARVKDRHAIYYVQRLAEWEQALKGPQQLATLDDMAQLINNLRQAWQWMLTNGKFKDLNSGKFDQGLFHSSLFSLSFFYEMRCRSMEAVNTFLEAAAFLKTTQANFEQSDGIYDDSVLGHVTACLGLHQMIVYQLTKARENLEEAIDLLENDAFRSEKALAQAILAWLYFQQGKMHRSAELLKQSAANYQKVGNLWGYLAISINLAQAYVLSGNLAESDLLYQEGSQLVAPGDIRLGTFFKRVNAYLYYFKNNYEKAEQLMHENLQLAYQFKNHRGIIALCLTDLCQVAQVTNRFDFVEKYAQECIDLVSEYGECYELAFAMLYSGKCFIARKEGEEGRKKFQQVIQMGQTFDAFFLVYWGMVNIARSYLLECQAEKALEIWRVLQDCPVEYKIALDEGKCLGYDLQAWMTKDQFEDTMRQGDDRVSLDAAEAAALAYALEFKTG